MTDDQLSFDDDPPDDDPPDDDPLPDPGRPGQGQAHAIWRGAPDTERLAARLIAPKTGSDRLTVLHAIAAAEHGLTDHELAATTGLYLYTAAPRRNELKRDGWVEDSGLRRPSAHAKRQPICVWALTAQGRREYAELNGG